MPGMDRNNDATMHEVIKVGRFFFYKNGSVSFHTAVWTYMYIHVSS